MRDLGYDARVMVPKYATIDMDKYPLHLEFEGIELVSEDKDPHGLLKSNVLYHENKEDKTITYFLENMEYYEKRANVYGYGDDTIRWVLLSRGALEFIKVSDWKPDIIVAADWQTGFIPNLIHTEYKNDPIISKIANVFSVHNLKHQGMFDPRFVSEMEYDAGQSNIPDFLDSKILRLNGMRRGIMYADVVNTVSPTYAKEIMTEEFGEGLNKLLSERKDRLFGILNGIDTEKLNPETDDNIPVNFSSKEIAKRADNKVALQKQFGLPVDKDKFIVGMVTRMAGQKGFDLLVKNLESLMENLDFQFIIIGEGEPKYRVFLEDLQKKYPDRIGGHFTFDSLLPRLIFGGADTVLIPSKYEPSGLVQMEAMRYGCIPIVRNVGGLADSVEDFDSQKNKGTGFVFEKYDPFSLAIVFVRAFEIFKQKKEWAKLVKRAMAKDFSWEKSAKEYIKIFNLTRKFHKKK
jgi:starch synthase